MVVQERKKLEMNKKKEKQLTQFGFRFGKSGAHLSRTLMFKELEQLLSYIDNPKAGKEDYLLAIKEDNCLGKRSGRTRIITTRHLVDLYGLSPAITIFRNLLYFWKRDQASRPLIALLCAYSRDPMLRLSQSYIFSKVHGHLVIKEELEFFLENLDPGRFSKATLQSTVRNINSTWTQSGHLSGRVKKVRTEAKATPGAVAYMLLLSFLNGVRGQNLFRSEYAKLLDVPVDHIIELAETASRKGWINFKRVGNVIEVLFPNLLTVEEMEWAREQG